MKILLTADNHLGRNLKKVKKLRKAFLDNFKLIPEKIKENNIDIVIFAGDIFDKENTDIDIYKVFLNTLKEIISISHLKYIFLITGNHDLYNEYFNAANIELCEILDSKKLFLATNEPKVINIEEFNATFFLLPYLKDMFFIDEKSKHKRFHDYIEKMVTEYLNLNTTKILISHFAIKEWMPFSLNSIELNELYKYKYFDFIFLGDLHNETFYDLKQTPVIYSGATMQTSILDLKNHKNSVKVIEIEGKNLKALDIVQLPQIEVLIVENFDEVSQFDTENIENKVFLVKNLDAYHYLRNKNALYVQYVPDKNEIEENILSNVEISEDAISDIPKLCENFLNQNNVDEKIKKYIFELLKIDVENLTQNELLKTISNIFSLKGE